jgi:hypothetical protein
VQLWSLLALQPDGQQPSPFLHVVSVAPFTHWAAHPVPISVRSWQPMAGQVVGQLPSHFSPQAASTTPLPHWQLQSLSLTLVQPEAQQPSPGVQVEMTVSFTHSALHMAGSPTSLRFWQPTLGQVVGQLPSHFSLPSTAPFPHFALQSLSLVALQPAGQQPSPWAQAVWVPSAVQAAVQVAAAPVSLRRAQPIQGQVAGQLEGGSQVSPASVAPFPHLATQSLSLVALQPAGQQPSPFVQAVCSLSATHWAWQVLPLTSLRS